MQALELGAIPLMVREPHTDKDFLGAVLLCAMSLCALCVLGIIDIGVECCRALFSVAVQWRGYPGPIFNSWPEARLMLLDVIRGHIR
jgi:hypothetical protein